MKKVVLILMLIATMIAMCGCYSIGNNSRGLDIKYTFHEAYISLPNGEVIHGEISSWRDFDDGDEVQITIDGNTYLTHYSNVIMIRHESN